MSRLIENARRWRHTLLVSCAVLLLVGLYFYGQRQRYKHFAVHDPGRVYRSAWVEADVFGELVRKYRIKTVVNLCFPGEMGNRNLAQRQQVEEAGARLIELPFPPNDTWDLDYPVVIEMERILDDPNNYPLWIHCQHGRERTVKALAMYDIRHRNLTAEDSLQAMPLFDMEHPWPIVVFAYNYETQLRGSHRSAASDCCAPPAATTAAAPVQRN